jgi:hypothetical protein
MEFEHQIDVPGMARRQFAPQARMQLDIRFGSEPNHRERPLLARSGYSTKRSGPKNATTRLMRLLQIASRSGPGVIQIKARL